jgi:hypothetical protein
MFQRPHYEWLARFAGEHLTVAQAYTLSDRLQRDNSQFDRLKFLRACTRCRELAHAPSESVFKT